MPKVQLNRAQTGEEVPSVDDNVIHSIYDPRYKEYQKLENRKKALAEYKKWHANVEKANPKSYDQYMDLMNKSDSLAYASKYLPLLPKEDQVPLWTSPSGTTINKKRDMTPVNNPYTSDIADLPWGEDQEQEDAFRAWVNEAYPKEAKAWDLDPSSKNLNNPHVRSAYYELGKEFEESRKPTPEAAPVVEETPVEEPTDERFAYKTQTLVYPDGHQEFRKIPYYNYNTRENLNPPGAIYVDEQGDRIYKQGEEGHYKFQEGGLAPMPNIGLNRFIPRAQQGMQQPGGQEQQMMQMIQQALMQGISPREIYNTLAKQLQGKIDPQQLNQMVTMAVETVKGSMMPNPQDDLDAASGLTTEEPMAAAPMMPSQNQMMTDQIMSEDMGDEALMKMGGPISKKKFVGNVLKLAKKQMGDAGKQGAAKASIRDTSEFERANIKNDFMTGVKEASTIAGIKTQAEEQYDMMMQQYGGYVDGNLKRFCKGGMKKYQKGDQIMADSPAPGFTWEQWGKLTPEQRQFIGSKLQGGNRYGDGAIGRTPQGMPIYPGIFDKKALWPRRNFRDDLYPFNKAIEYAGSYGKAGQAKDLQGRNYTGGINYDDAVSTDVTKTGLFGRPKEWTTYYNIDPNNPTASYGDAQQGTQRDSNKGEGNALQNMWWKMRRGRAEQKQMGGLTKYQILGEVQGNQVQLEEPYETPEWQTAFQDQDVPEMPYDQPMQYEVNENMGGEGTPFGSTPLIPNQVGVQYKRKDMYNIDPESALQQFNAAANFSIGLLEKKDQASQQKWLYDQLNADNLYGGTRKRKLGNWDQLGNFRPDQQGFRGVAQSGGEMPSEGEEVFMSEEEIQRFIDEGGELEFI